MIPKVASIDEYLKTVPADRRAALEKLRRTILAVLPKAEECISYRMPAFRVEGVTVAGFIATKAGCSYFPFSGRTLTTLATDVRGYGQTKGSLHFDAVKGLPVTLVRKLIKARLAEAKARAD